MFGFEFCFTLSIYVFPQRLFLAPFPSIKSDRNRGIGFCRAAQVNSNAETREIRSSPVNVLTSFR